jgi:hypothetical protein
MPKFRIILVSAYEHLPIAFATAKESKTKCELPRTFKGLPVENEWSSISVRVAGETQARDDTTGDIVYKKALPQVSISHKWGLLFLVLKSRNRGFKGLPIVKDRFRVAH